LKIFLVRHAKAGDREAWTKPDVLRPLTGAGRAQAAALVGRLSGFPIERVISSRYARCVQTVEPLAAARGIRLELDEALAEGASLDGALALLAKLAGPAALCSHGDVIELVVGHLQDSGVPGADARLGKKGSTWVLEAEDGTITGAAYLEPPA
jgi:8-oxo-dGTP diphosphatase